jgi:16S rRNA (guanine1207-N2)-methyltransferase/23S rRNA (guanine1835-N2)-methyltransferase
MSNTQLDIQAHSLQLKRFPHNQFDRSLRAWDAADEYMIDHVCSHIDTSSLNNIVIIGDSFGALTCAMSLLAPQAKITIFTDSYMSELGIQKNLQKNQINEPLANNRIRIQDSLNLSSNEEKSLLEEDIGVATPDLVLIKIPRTLAFLEYLLIQTNQLANNSTQIVAGAMVKLVTSSVMKLFDKHFNNTRSSLARKKSRLIFAEQAKEKLKETPAPRIVNDPCISFSLHNYPNVFCREQIDIGARYLLQHLPETNKPEHTIIDLGCGNGILGISILVDAPEATVYFVDESYMAIASAKNSFKQSGAKGKARFLVSHALSNIQSEDKHFEGADTIICNPPFHQQSTVLDDIAWQMFVDAKKHLKVGGELRIVGNRHLEHRAKLSKLFGGCKVIASDKKFVVLSAIKQTD